MRYRLVIAAAIIAASFWGQSWADNQAVSARAVELARVQAMQPRRDTTCCRSLPMLPFGLVVAGLILTWRRGYRDDDAPTLGR